MYGLHAWQFPLAAAFMWAAYSNINSHDYNLGSQGKPVYKSQDGSIPYISDIGASFLKPLFVGKGSTPIERPTKGSSDGVISCICALIAAAGLSLLAGFDTLNYTTLHRLFLWVKFKIEEIETATNNSLYQRARHAAGLADTTDFTFNITKMIQGLAGSYIAKLIIVVIEIALSIAFGITMYKGSNEVAAVLEWMIAYIFVFFLITFYFDLRPAAGSPKGKYDVSRIVGVGSRAELGPGGRPSMSTRASGSEQVTPEMGQVQPNVNRV
ncbi:Frag1 domain-containing protein [Rhizoctonia solani]|uniref:Frag1 domain-containing protein n=1 Tax=Rhizoctonia solani TaxID=456999 RepID=A0A8H8P6C4_9AGAM|nr:Frag1 domain-containing protein [Rhizoctonia solani]QRW26446.1 Frag1 domain-containing protein [Rhizoctonia solani]